jgi:hypothetical protein
MLLSTMQGFVCRAAGIACGSARRGTVSATDGARAGPACGGLALVASEALLARRSWKWTRVSIAGGSSTRPSQSSLRVGELDRGAAELQRIVGQIGTRWAKVKITLRADLPERWTSSQPVLSETLTTRACWGACRPTASGSLPLPQRPVRLHPCLNATEPAI